MLTWIDEDESKEGSKESKQKWKHNVERGGHGWEEKMQVLKAQRM